MSGYRLEKASVEAELEATRSRASHTQQSLGEQLVQGVTSLTVQLHMLKGLNNSLHMALVEQVTPPPPRSHKHGAVIPIQIMQQYNQRPFS